jgi:6-phosphogluconolactonase (cycloisomerase 2 family)
VSNRIDNTISLFTIDSAIGSLHEVLPRTPAGLTPGFLVMDAPGNFLFALNQISSSVSVYSINSASGALTAVAGSPFTTAPNPVALAIAPSGKFLYVLNANLSAVFAYTISSGVLQPIAGLPAQVGNGALAITVVLGTFATGIQPIAVAVLGQYLYVANQGSSNISVFTVAPTTGVLTQITNSPFSAGGAPSFELIDPSGLFLYTGSQTGNVISALSIDVSTGDLTATSGSATTGSAPSSMSVSK